MDQISHDENLKALKEAAEKDNFTINEKNASIIILKSNFWDI